MNSEAESQLLRRVDGSGKAGERDAVAELKRRYGSELPRLLLEHYKTAKSYKIRAACVYYCLDFSRVSNAAIELAKIAIADKSRVVRYRACMLLACSLRSDILPTLRQMIPSTERETRDDLIAAIDAIEHQNKDFFLDREHSGMIALRVLSPSKTIDNRERNRGHP